MKSNVLLVVILLQATCSIYAQKVFFEGCGRLYGNIESVIEASYATYCDSGFLQVDTMELDRSASYIYPNHQTFAGPDMFVPVMGPMKYSRYDNQGSVVETALIDGDQMDWCQYRYDRQGRLKEQASGVGRRYDGEDEFETFFSMSRQYSYIKRVVNARKEAAKK
ncbi:MAG: hypothetical protein KBH36_00435 [Acidaminococcaceae bacterium]|nr:hypothetical protein [Acidaminococcaceae bacterium]